MSTIYTCILRKWKQLPDSKIISFVIHYSYSIQIRVVQKVFTTSKLCILIICCPLLSFRFSLRTNILMEQITLPTTHIKHLRSTVSNTDGESSLSHAKNSLTFCVFAVSLCVLFPVLSFSFFSRNHFHTNGLSYTQPCSSVSSLTNGTFSCCPQWWFFQIFGWPLVWFPSCVLNFKFVWLTRAADYFQPAFKR